MLWENWFFSGFFRQSENGFLVVFWESPTGFLTLKKSGNPAHNLKGITLNFTEHENGYKTNFPQW